jgi:lipopolysaccharide transport system permease protein
MSGPILWQYFQDTFTKTASTFIDNQAVFGKVYFPRLIMPLTVLISGLLKFSVQLCLLLCAICYYYFQTETFSMQWEIIYFPVLLLIIMVMAIGFGLLVSSITTKYRDIKFLIDFAVPLIKYITPGIATSYVVFVQTLPKDLVFLAKYNPIGYLIDSFNYMCVGAGCFDWIQIAYSGGFAVTIFLFGLLIFNQVEKNFMDTV